MRLASAHPHGASRRSPSPADASRRHVAEPRTTTSQSRRAAVVAAHPYAETTTLPSQVAQTVSGRRVLLTSSVTAARTLSAEPETELLIVHLEGVDRFRDGWPGHRLIERVTRAGACEVLAWVAADDLDAHELARRLGVSVVRTSPRHGPRRKGEPVPEWFRRRHNAAWQPWMVEAAVALASGADRTTQAEFCRAAWGLDKTSAAHRRLRLLREIVCAETREHPGLEQRLAVEVLRVLSTALAIQIEPLTTRSVHVAARGLLTDPGLADAIGLTSQQAADVLAVADAVSALAGGVSSSSGRPTANAWRVRREQAVGRVASERGNCRSARDCERRRILEHLECSLLTIHDAIEERQA